MEDQVFREWLARKSWVQAVRYCKVVAVLLPAAALALNAPSLLNTSLGLKPGAYWLVAWQLCVELTCIAVILVDRSRPQRVEKLLYVFCAIFMALTTWAGVRGSLVGGGGLIVFAAGSTFIAAAICTPRAVRRPMYALSLVALGAAAWWRTGDLGRVVADLVHPFWVVFLCMELDRITFAQRLELYEEKQNVERERARADKVLYNVLPASIADELKRHDKVNAVKFENMGVLFADIAGFTSFSRAMPPDALVMVLNQIFSSFDAVVEDHGLEKIKTIGDAYMVTSHNRICALCELALDMCDAMDSYNKANGTRLGMRVGIHAGPAVAGVIGVKRFLYDVWGDTVNVASRMEATGEPGRVHVTEAVYLQARDCFAFEEREPIDIKGRGTMVTYWLAGRLSSSAAPAPSPLPAPETRSAQWASS